MISLSLTTIADLVGATVSDPAGTQVTGSVEVDSRLVGPGGLFVALGGEHADGHDYVAEAFARGAVAAVTARPCGSLRCLVVPDPLAALQGLGRAIFAMGGPPLTFGITGSSGKTTTKDLMAHVLSAKASTLAPKNSFNNEIGFPLTLLRRDEQTRVAVLEYSARGVGHIGFLCGLAAPDVAVVLNVGSAHLGEFGSREVIARAKGELVAHATTRCILNADDPLVMGMVSRLPRGVEVQTFGAADEADYRAEGVELDAEGRATFALCDRRRGRTAQVRLRLHGRHHVHNALAVAAATATSGLFPGGLEEVAALLGGAVPESRWRMEVSQRSDGVTIVNDAYNANPESMRAAIEALAVMGRGGRRTLAVLGPMAELGSAASAEHRSLGRFAAAQNISQLVVVGPDAAGIHEGAAGAASVRVVDREAAVALLRRELRPGDVVLVKASRAAGFELVSAALLDSQP